MDVVDAGARFLNDDDGFGVGEGDLIGCFV